jgi:hypothetical protein
MFRGWKRLKTKTAEAFSMLCEGCDFGENSGGELTHR